MTLRLSCHVSGFKRSVACDAPVRNASASCVCAPAHASIGSRRRRGLSSRFALQSSSSYRLVQQCRRGTTVRRAIRRVVVAEGPPGGAPGGRTDLPGGTDIVGKTDVDGWTDTEARTDVGSRTDLGWLGRPAVWHGPLDPAPAAPLSTPVIPSGASALSQAVRAPAEAKPFKPGSSGAAREKVAVVVEETQVWQAQPSMEELPVLCFPGGGMFFYWQLGAVSAIAKHCNLQRTRMVGASAGALAATLAACGVDARHAAEAAFDLSLANGVWSRPNGLAGIWGPLVRQWLDDLLPRNAAALCNNRLSLHLVTLPSIRNRAAWFGREVVSWYDSRDEVVAACAASTHVPFFMDAKPWTHFRGRRCIDGSLFVQPSQLVPPGQAAIFLDFSLDEEMRLRRWEFLSLGRDAQGDPQRTWEWIEEMMARGHTYARTHLVNSGRLDALLRPPQSPVWHAADR